ncbi:MAG: bifunctional DNA-formamidopyrimidine glycosylase/DNA-(apurinic or apyrimidinic site) lyase [Longimicrobiales bacterium]
MPELPEAETIARGLNAVLPGRTIQRVKVPRADVVSGAPAPFARSLEGRKVVRVGRRGKNVVFELAPSSRLVVNLGMTGRLLTSPSADPPPGSAHPGVLFRFDDDSSLIYDDIRRFGRLSHLEGPAWKKWSRTLGPEPLGSTFTGDRFLHVLSSSRSPIRSLLLDQRKVAGVGNIYAVEALWKAGVHPASPSNGLGTAAGRRLHRALRQILRRAIEARGTTLKDYRTADGGTGGFGPELLAYGREGDGCKRCSTAIERMRLGGRSAYYCPKCQLLPAPDQSSTSAA